MTEKKLKKTEKRLSVGKIRCARDVQPRVAMDKAVVDEYAARLKAGDKLPRIVVFFDGATYWLAEGFHRLEAHKKAGRKQIDCIVIEGTKQDAQWHALQSNKDHGLRRSNEDKAKAVKMALAHPNGADMSDRQIAEVVGVSPTMVGKLRQKAEPTVHDGQSRKRKGRDGRTIDTAKIGKKDKGKSSGNGKAGPAGQPTGTTGDKTPTPQVDREVEEPAEVAVDGGNGGPVVEVRDNAPVSTYRRMLENLPGALDELVAKVDDIAGQAMAPKAARKALARILSRILVLQAAEEAKSGKKSGARRSATDP